MMMVLIIKMNIQEQLQTLYQDALKLKLRHSDKAFQLAFELEQDIKAINEKLKFNLRI